MAINQQGAMYEFLPVNFVGYKTYHLTLSYCKLSLPSLISSSIAPFLELNKHITGSCRECVWSMTFTLSYTDHIHQKGTLMLGDK